jgi:hypothetical protein
MAETDISGRRILYQLRGVMVVHGPHKFPRRFPGVSAAVDNEAYFAASDNGWTNYNLGLQ